jgi:hypothetical protein
MRRLAAIAVALPLTFLAVSAHATTISFGGNSYFLTSASGTWSEAEAEAVSLGGHLASIHNAADNQLLADTFVAGAPLWIGLADLSLDGAGGSHSSNFFWSDGSVVDYTNWQGAQGSTSNKTTWNDTPLAGSSGYGGASSGPYFGIIEVANAPEPASLGLAIFGFAALGFGALKRRRIRR